MGYVVEKLSNILTVTIGFGLLVAGCASAPNLGNFGSSDTAIAGGGANNNPNDPNSNASGGGTVGSGTVTREFDEPPPQTPVCNPFSDGNPSDRTTGLKGTLSYLDPATVTQPSQMKVMDFWNVSPAGNLIPKNSLPVVLFSTELDVPTRAFTEGFFVAGDDLHPLLVPNTTTVLMEWFSVHFQSTLKLGNAAPGKYAFAILSDDGSVMKVDRKDGNGMTALINNDGVHAERLGCAAPTNLVTLDATHPSVDIDVNYFQGPRYHIALVLIWKKIDPNAPLGASIDPACGSGNVNYFFDSTVNPPTAKQPWNDLLSRGWEVVPSDNFQLQRGQTNPCN